MGHMGNIGGCKCDTCGIHATEMFLGHIFDELRYIWVAFGTVGYRTGYKITFCLIPLQLLLYN